MRPGRVIGVVILAITNQNRLYLCSGVACGSLMQNCFVLLVVLVLVLVVVVVLVLVLVVAVAVAVAIAVVVVVAVAVV